jgi:2-oxoglutarate ferredoxin oxidoreductase subunit alpha
VRTAREKGLKVGLLRPITVAPFPKDVIDQLTQQVKAFLVVEMNSGQMLEDVRLVVQGRKPVEFFGRMGGVVPLPDEVEEEIERLIEEPLTTEGHPRDRWLARLSETIG